MEKALRFMAWVFAIFVVLCIFGRLTVFETWTVPDNPYTAASLAPTLGAGDFVLVTTVGEASFGELVRCPDPEDNTHFVVGRLTGLGGDRVEVKSRTLRVNGRRYDSADACTEPRISVTHPDTGSEIELQCARVDMGGGWHYRANLPSKYNRNNDHVKDVGTGKVYLLSDNRDFHDDSRDYGTLPEESCQQRIFFRLWGGKGWTDTDSRLTFIR